MSTRTLGMLAIVVGSTLGAWWLVTQQRSRGTRQVSDRGTVIYDNTPLAADIDAMI